MIKLRRNWTSQDEALLRKLYPTHTAAQVAERIFGTGRAAKAVYQKAFEMRLRKTASIDSALIERVRKLHAKGLHDVAIAEKLGLTRDDVHHIRYGRLKLPPNEAAILEARRRGQKTQLERLGLDNTGQLRALAFRQRAIKAGWPADLRPRAVQILNLLYEHGPQTRRQIADAIGMPWKGSRKSLVSNDPEGSYLAHLMARGLVVCLGRLVKGQGSGGSVCLYALPLGVDKEKPDERTSA